MLPPLLNIDVLCGAKQVNKSWNTDNRTLKEIERSCRHLQCVIVRDLVESQTAEEIVMQWIWEREREREALHDNMSGGFIWKRIQKAEHQNIHPGCYMLIKLFFFCLSSGLVQELTASIILSLYWKIEVRRLPLALTAQEVASSLLLYPAVSFCGHHFFWVSELISKICPAKTLPFIWIGILCQAQHG